MCGTYVNKSNQWHFILSIREKFILPKNITLLIRLEKLVLGASFVECYPMHSKERRLYTIKRGDTLCANLHTALFTENGLLSIIKLKKVKILSMIKAEPLCKYAFYILGKQMYKECMVGWPVDPRDVHALILETCKYVSLHGKGDSVDVIELMSLRWRDYPGGSNVITSVLIRGRQEWWKSEKKWQWKQSLEWCHCWKGPWAKECRWPLEAGKNKEWILL